MHKTSICHAWHKSSLVSCLVLINLASFSSVVLSEQLPNETDLQATYCLGFWKTAYNDIATSYHSLPTSEDPPTIPQLNRLQSYLRPRIPYLDVYSILEADKSGKEDYRIVMNDANRCLNTCQSDKSCEASCIGKSEANIRSAKCKDLKFLPY